MLVSAIACLSLNNIIGRDGALPWTMPSDLRRFKSFTLGKPIIMGRKTWESIGSEKLPGRYNIVITESLKFKGRPDDFELSIKDSLYFMNLWEKPPKEVFVIGGESLFKDLSVFDRLYITEIQALVDGDRRFPPIDETFRLVYNGICEKDPRDQYDSRFKIYDKVATYG
jgi:dihydrofolate reductase